MPQVQSKITSFTTKNSRLQSVRMVNYTWINGVEKWLVNQQLVFCRRLLIAPAQGSNLVKGFKEWSGRRLAMGGKMTARQIQSYSRTQRGMEAFLLMATTYNQIAYMIKIGFVAPFLEGKIENRTLILDDIQSLTDYLIPRDWMVQYARDIFDAIKTDRIFAAANPGSVKQVQIQYILEVMEQWAVEFLETPLLKKKVAFVL